MTETLKQVEVILKKAALEGALTEAALKQFSDLVEERDDLVTSEKALEEKNEMLKKQLKESSESRQKAESALGIFKNREQELLKREKKITLLEQEAHWQGKRVEDHLAMVTLVFRNTELRRSVNRITSVPTDQPNNQYYSDISTEETTTTETEE